MKKLFRGPKPAIGNRAYNKTAYMLKKFEKSLDDLKGTASELFENSAYDNLVNLVGESGAARAIQSKLNERKISVEEWETYRRVRRKMHQEPLGVKQILKDVNSLSESCIDDDSPSK